jgi:energy-coupling factor transport system substrate-specific component
MNGLEFGIWGLVAATIFVGVLGFFAIKHEKRWENIDLITIGTFAALIKVSSYLITVCGGGMNPIAFILKNIMVTALTVVLCHKVRKFGTLSLYLTISFLFGVVITGGGGHIAFPVMLIGALMADGLIMLFGGYRKTLALLVGVAFYDLFSRFIGFAISYLTVRENKEMMVMALVVVGIGYIGCLIGLPSGILLLKELRHAGIVRK